jgi:hypothetical protein
MLFISNASHHIVLNRKKRIAKIDSKDSNFIRGHWKIDDANSCVRVRYTPYWDILEQLRNLRTLLTWMAYHN